MKILLDECLPHRLARLLPGHDVRTVQQMKWLGLSNGRLLDAAQAEFEVFVTVDKNLVHQQKVVGRPLMVIVLSARSNKIEDLSPLVPQLVSALSSVKPGSSITLS